MIRKLALCAGALCAALVMGGVTVYLPLSGEQAADAPSERPTAAAMAAVGAPKLKSIYGNWTEQHELSGGDRNTRFLLGRTGMRDHMSREESKYVGRVRLDAIDGVVSVDVSRLPASGGFDVWLIDDRAGEGNSIEPDATDLYIRAGSLAAPADGGDVWTLKAELGGDAFRTFQVDQVAVTKAGEHPTEATVLRGGPDLFQRMYTAMRTPELFAVSDYVSAETAPERPVLGVATAQAARQSPLKPIEVDPDVVLNKLIALGADVFINELFDGNGRTCETCHPFLNNITIDPSEIARRPDSDPIFLAEQNPAFAGPPFPLDDPRVLRATALIGIPDDGLNLPSIQRAVPHLFFVNGTFGPPAPVVLPFAGQGAPTPPGAPPLPPAPFLLPDLNDPNDPSRAFGLPIGPPPAAPGLPGGVDVPGAGFPFFGFTVDNGTNPPIDRLGFAGDLGFAPDLGLFGRLGDAVPGAVALLLPKTPARIPGRDFRFPTPQETDAVVAFYLTLGRSQELNLDALKLSNVGAERGRRIFINRGGTLANLGGPGPQPVVDDFGNPITAGKCNVCHNNAGALSDKDLFDTVCAGLGAALGLPFAPRCGATNFNFETGVERLRSQPAVVVAGGNSVLPNGPQGPGTVFVDGGFGVVPHFPGVPRGAANPADPNAPPCFTVPVPGLQDGLDLPSGGFGSIIGIDFPGTQPAVLAGACTEEFNTPPLVEAADTPPFFHNNNSNTIESAVEFYNTTAFNRSSAAAILGAITDGVTGIDLENTEVQQVASFLRVINAAENVRSAVEFAQTANGIFVRSQFDQLLMQAIAQGIDAVDVLEEARLNARQVDDLQAALDLLMGAIGDPPRIVRERRRFGFFFRTIERVVTNDDVDLAVKLLQRASAGLFTN
jgi:hypothetical protein